jgi:galactose-6-phosphate isomerase
MALLNLSLVVTNPMLCDWFKVRRRTVIVGGNGRASTSDRLIKAYGVVQADGDNTQERPKEAANGRKTISVITKYPLQDQVRFALPDIILWRGDEYLCESLDDMTNYGPGFVEATCTSQDAQDAPPGTA